MSLLAHTSFLRRPSFFTPLRIRIREPGTRFPTPCTAPRHFVRVYNCPIADLVGSSYALAVCCRMYLWGALGGWVVQALDEWVGRCWEGGGGVC